MNTPSYPGAAEQICKLKPGSFLLWKWCLISQSSQLHFAAANFPLCLTKQDRATSIEIDKLRTFCKTAGWMRRTHCLSHLFCSLSIFVLVLKSSIQHCLKTNQFPFHWGKRLMSVTQWLWVPFFLLKEISTEQSLFIIAMLLSDHLPLYFFLPQPLWKQTSCPRHRNPQSAASSMEPLDFCQQPLEVVPDVITFSVLPWKYPVKTKDCTHPSYRFGGQHFLCSQGCTVRDVRHVAPQRNHD